MIDLLSIEFRNYKCFSSYCGFQTIKPTNIILGKNNVGKSSILDPIAMLCSGNFDSRVVLRVETTIKEGQAAAAFPPTTNGGDVGGNHWEIAGKNLVGKKLKVRTVGAWAPSLESYEDDATRHLMSLSGASRLVSTIPNPFSGWTVRKISAERDIQPELENFGSLDISPNGAGCTSLVMNVINRSELDSDLIQKHLCAELNSIVGPEILIDSIVIQRNPTNQWEVYLDDHTNGRVAMSRCGSGLKTIMLVLLELLVIPKFQGGNQKIFIFEELENNLHPSMQRRLMKYVHNFACSTGAIVFMTTHSNIVIDLFAEDSNASLYSLIRQDGVPITLALDSFLRRKNILSDLGVHASDILQSNALIWVEGPSDRVYLKHFIELYSDNALQEGVHYQFMYYGGRLLSHYSADQNADADLISLLRVNTNCAIIMDSDKKNQQSKVGVTKARIVKEFEASRMFAWITAGREIENYIPGEALREKLEDAALSELDRYQDIKDYLNAKSSGMGDNFERSKVEFAREIIRYISKENTVGIFDLATQVGKLVDSIALWNRA